MSTQQNNSEGNEVSLSTKVATLGVFSFALFALRSGIESISESNTKTNIIGLTVSTIATAGLYFFGYIKVEKGEGKLIIT